MKKVLEEEKEKSQLLSITAFGCNSDCKEKLDVFFQQKLDGSSYFFYEYFLLNPFVRNVGTSLGRMTAPFLDRLLNKMNFIPDFRKIKKIEELSIKEQGDDSLFRESLKNYEEIDFVSRTNDMLFKYWKNPRFVDHGEKAILGGKTSKEWMTFEGKSYEEKNKYKIEFGKLKKDKIYSFGSLSLKYLKNSYIADIADNVNLSNNDKFAALIEFLIVMSPCLKANESNNLQLIVIPIASTNIYFGHIIVFYMAPNGLARDDTTDLAKLIIKVVEDIYLPVLMLFQNYWDEKQLKDGIKEITNKILEEKLRSECFLFSHSVLKDSSNKIESGLYRLWKNRQKLLNSTRSDEDKREDFKKSLIFTSYMIASPGMIKQVRHVIDLTSRLKKSGGTLPSVIVIGGPGSGKENMAKLIHYLSDEYAFYSLHVLNMAVLRPKDIVPMLIMGAEIESEIGEKVRKSFSLLGMFEKALKKDKKATFILDELNSLDIDSQSSLLRLIEQGELSKIGSIEKPKEVKFLIIGIMNEDPDRLTHEFYLRKILRDEMFGGMFGEFIYEYFRKLRRLREDLYHRMKRGGKIVLPELNDRRYDIPILFRVFISQELSDNEKLVYLSFEGLELLIDSSIEWPGNIRQLQTVAKVTLDEASSDQGEDQGEIKILKKHIKKALENEKLIKKPVSDVDETET